ncbi:MAG: hypothetical protein KGZ59_03905 [Chitinophagaceae bacterium]|nr:hypothetical protein [Chitinophagaceae bacterium]
MKLKLYILVVIFFAGSKVLLVVGCPKNDTCRIKYFKQVLFSQSHTSPFLVVKVRDNNLIKTILIRNCYLFDYYKLKFSYNIKEYEEALTFFLLSDSTLPIQIESLSSYNFSILNTNSEVNKFYSKKGFDRAKEFYLKKSGDSLIGRISLFEGLDIFFKNKYFLKTSDEGGYLYFEKFECN